MIKKSQSVKFLEACTYDAVNSPGPPKVRPNRMHVQAKCLSTYKNQYFGDLGPPEFKHV